LNPFLLLFFISSLRRLVEVVEEVCLVFFDDAACCAEEVFAEDFVDSPSAVAGPDLVPAVAFAEGFRLAAAEVPVFDPDPAEEVWAAEVACFVAEAVAAFLVVAAVCHQLVFAEDFQPGLDLAVDVAGARFCSCCDAVKNVFSSCHFYQGSAS